ncbi:MAG: hypothetical protein IKI76_11610 [Selenomonadaceae bacterium]|nr:hypothetical protein [Selenomonadaceae bacterium]
MAEVLFGIDFGACNLKCVRLVNKKFLASACTPKTMAPSTRPTPFAKAKTRTARYKKQSGKLR